MRRPSLTAPRATNSTAIRLANLGQRTDQVKHLSCSCWHYGSRPSACRQGVWRTGRILDSVSRSKRSDVASRNSSSSNLASTALTSRSRKSRWAQGRTGLGDSVDDARTTVTVYSAVGVPEGSGSHRDRAR
jgi:hypothetical protein